MNARAAIASLGAGRMGRGIAVAFTYAGHPVTLVDFKPRDAASFARLAAEATDEVRGTLTSLANDAASRGLKSTSVTGWPA